MALCILMYTIFLLASLTSASPIRRSQAPASVPGFVTEYAPVVYLFYEETYFPGDIASFLQNLTPQVNFKPIDGASDTYTLNDLNELNQYGNNGANVYLTTKTPEYDYPSFYAGVKPDSTGQTQDAVTSVIIVNELDDENTDVFYWYFYPFNYGGTYAGQTIDLHVGDWEYNAIRFSNGTPTQIWYSQHSYGSAYTYDAVSKYKNGPRPIDYSANGTHANYASSGVHEIALTSDDIHIPGIDDFTNAGTYWDPTLSAYYYSYNNATQIFTAYDSSYPVDWLSYYGQFGNQQLPTSDPNQKCILDITSLCKWDSGPTGPVGHQLSRSTICPDAGNCNVSDTVSQDP